MIRKKKINVYTCNKCKHEWIAKRKELPRMCPKCKTVRWNDKGVKNG